MEIGRDDKLVFAVNFFDHFQQQLLHRSNKTGAQQLENVTITLRLSHPNWNGRDVEILTVVLVSWSRVVTP